ncbi:low molecular weight protein arginine phosphatase [Desertibacillus haloalkaliphilus]|uniref:low molecular weight protein arginine phosphatase n=1 Tax=Desertibacillus haloalkaliphilus TaxID=1328930 RepID=UPI001C268EBC|nr:low molecular weight protein arginine phosphatase [Desertibacillus haloalkaliphilus]MBU8905874.1 low molecular weight protein arginine phosphatase [Desertibacillus haloalkaliphilus]
MKRFLFVCTGNTCRSPLAEALLRERLKEEVEVKSAGVSAFPGQDASSGTKQVLEEMGIASDHKSQLVSDKLLSWADVVLTMTDSHKQLLNQQFPSAIEKVYTLKEYTGADHVDRNISDPFGGPVEVYRETAKEIEGLIEQLAEKTKGD